LLALTVLLAEAGEKLAKNVSHCVFRCLAVQRRNGQARNVDTAENTKKQKKKMIFFFSFFFSVFLSDCSADGAHDARATAVDASRNRRAGETRVILG
jgi:hypothetical protein